MCSSLVRAGMYPAVLFMSWRNRTMRGTAMILRLIVGGFMGAIIGGAIGFLSKCAGGTCPMTCTPVRGIIAGVVLGLLFALSAVSRAG